MDLKIFILLFLLVVVGAKKDQTEHSSIEEGDTDEFQSKKSQDYVSRTPAGTSRQASIGENAIEKFVETLMSSEKYLKMIDSVERKISHLDSVFHGKTNNILKYLSEMQKVLNASSTESVLKTLNTLQTDMKQVKVLLREALELRPSMRGKLIYFLYSTAKAKILSCNTIVKLFKILCYKSYEITILTILKNISIHPRQKALSSVRILLWYVIRSTSI